jgi:threonine/homoserine/homoserine lactone efflux protein
MTAAAFLSIALIHLLAAISPGPSFVMTVRTAASEGLRTGLAVALGLGAGAMVWALAALFGLHLVFELAPALLLTFKLAGAGFLLWIAFQTWRHAREPLPAPETGATARGLGGGFRLGLLTQLANPKPAVFFGAVFVGLVPPASSPAALALLLLVLFLDETLWYALVARVFSLERARAAYGRAKASVDRVFGGLIALFGLKIAIG